MEDQHETELAAYHLWQQRGCPLGTPEIDWYRAEKEAGEQTEPAVITIAERMGSALGSMAGVVASVGSLIRGNSSEAD